MRQIVSMLSIALFCSAPAWAGVTPNPNPDQLDVDGEVFYSDDVEGADFNWAEITHSSEDNEASGAVSTTTVDGDFAQVWWALWEPDRVKRSQDRGKMSQKSYVEIYVSTWDTSASTGDTGFSTFEKCKAKTKVTGDGPDNPEDAKWNLSCKGAFAAMLAQSSPIGADALIRLEVLLGEYVDVKKDKIKISGKGPIPPPSS
jgi:hypothetical protein